MSALTADRAEGAVRLVYYSRNAANLGDPLRRFVGATATALRQLRRGGAAAALQGAFRVDVERVEVGHWSLVAQRRPGRNGYIDLGFTNEEHDS